MRICLQLPVIVVFWHRHVCPRYCVKGVSLHGLYATVNIRAVCTVVALLLFKGFVALTFICNL